MNEHHYTRLDKGIKRGRREKREANWKDTEAEGREVATTKELRPISQYSPELRAQAILEAAEGLEIGIRPTTIAQKHGIPQSTLYSWLLDNEVAELARSRFFHGQLGYALARMEEPEDLHDPLELARWRDIRRAWSEVAAVRDPKNYGQKQEVSHKVEVNVRHVEFDSSAAELLGKLRPAIEGTCVVEPADEPILP